MDGRLALAWARVSEELHPVLGVARDRLSGAQRAEPAPALGTCIGVPVESSSLAGPLFPGRWHPLRSCTPCLCPSGCLHTPTPSQSGHLPAPRLVRHLLETAPLHQVAVPGPPRVARGLCVLPPRSPRSTPYSGAASHRVWLRTGQPWPELLPRSPESHPDQVQGLRAKVSGLPRLALCCPQPPGVSGLAELGGFAFIRFGCPGP